MNPHRNLFNSPQSFTPQWQHFIQVCITSFRKCENDIRFLFVLVQPSAISQSMAPLSTTTSQFIELNERTGPFLHFTWWVIFDVLQKNSPQGTIHLCPVWWLVSCLNRTPAIIECLSPVFDSSTPTRKVQIHKQRILNFMFWFSLAHPCIRVSISSSSTIRAYMQKSQRAQWKPIART